ncbi:transporter [Paraburkholderia sp. J69-1]|uniref:SphA family protein n=1 Tax=unclassified Paraburkholderia TaxID=2615204 RepID=UPI0039EFE8A6
MQGTIQRIGGACALATLAAIMSMPQHAQAFEGGISPYPASATGDNIASMPPFPGLFALQQFNYSFSNGLYGNDGQKLAVPFHSSVVTSVTRLLASYPFEIYGARFYSQVVIPVVSLHTTVAGQHSSQNGLSNITVSPVIVDWRPTRELSFAAGLDIALETGSYSATKASVAVGYTSLQPVFAVRYDQPGGLDIGISNRFLLNQRNSTTNYTSGDAWLGEFEAGWHLGRWKLGVVGSYLNQYSDDTQNGATVSAGYRTRSFGFGPSIVYDAGPVKINLNYQQGLYAANTSKSNNVWLNIAVPLM